MAGPSDKPSPRFYYSVLPLLIVALDGIVTEVNAATAALLGRDPGDLHGVPLVGLAAGAGDAEALTEQWALARQGAGGGQAEVGLSRPDGEGVPCWLTWSRIPSEIGEEDYLSVVLVDQTAQRRAERDLHLSRARQQSLLRNASDAIWTVTEDGIIRTVDSALTTARTLPETDIVGRHLLSFVHDDDRERMTAAWQSALEPGGGPVTVEARLTGPRAQPLWVRQTFVDLRADAAVGALVGYTTDISAFRREQESRRRADAIAHARFHGSSVPQAVADLSGVLTDANEALGQLMGVPADALIGKPILGLVHASDDPDPHPGIAAILAGQLQSIGVKRIIAGPSGKPLSLHLDLTLLRNEHGEPLAVNAYIQDETLLVDSERRHRLAEDFHTALDALAKDMTIVADSDGEIVFASPSLREVLGLDLWDVTGLQGKGYVHPDDLPLALAAFERVRDGAGPESFLARAHHADGTVRWLEHTLTDSRESAIGGFVISLQDVTGRVEAEARLRDSEARFRTISETAGEGIWTVDTAGRTLYANDRMLDLLGVTRADLECGKVSAQVRIQAATLALAAGGEAHSYQIGHVWPDGSLRTLLVSASPLPGVDGSVEGALGMVSDVTEARDAEEQLRHRALHDELTGLANRHLLHDRLDQALSQEGETALLLLDLDRFQHLNDSRNHEFGDRVISAVAAALRSVTRQQDTVSRFGGDEFAVVCDRVDRSVALRLAQDVLQAVADLKVVEGVPLNLSASIGVALSPGSPSDLLRFADSALFAAKAAGRGRIRFFEPSLLASIEQSYDLASALRAAIDEDGLTVHYQPIVDLETGETVGLEALTRWHRGEQGPVSPAVFVPIAENTGMSADLDRWVLRRAFHEVGELLRAGHLRPDCYVSVNLSSGNLADSWLRPFLVEAAATAGMPTGQVVLEITEGAVMANPTEAVAQLEALRSEGFRVAVDDFGTGHSSLAYLRDLPVTSLKIDRSFVFDLATNVDALAIASSILELARAVGLSVVAEGVEDRDQMRVLRSLGCPYGQGWLWAPALRPEDIVERRLVEQPFDVSSEGDSADQVQG